jgi:hypothetical protein
VRRTAAPATLAALTSLGTVLLLAACSPPAGAGEDEIAAWLGRPDDTSAGDRALGEARARITPTPDAETEPGAEISLTYPAPVRLEDVRLSCLGGGTLDFTVSVTTSEGTTGRTVADVPCDEAAYEHAVPADGVTDVRVDASGADRDGAWSAVLLGETA